MAKNKDNSSIFGVSDLAEKARKRIEVRESEETSAPKSGGEVHNTHTQHTIHTHNTQAEYTIPQEETRSKRIQIVIQPSVNRKLDRLVKEGKVKSKNDLVNFLLKSYIEQFD